MTLPLIGFLYLYLLFIVVWLIFSIIALYHILRYGQINFICLTVILVYLAVAAAILALSFEFLKQIDWSVSPTILQAEVGVFGSSNY